MNADRLRGKHSARWLQSTAIIQKNRDGMMQQFLAASAGGEMTWMPPPNASQDDPLLLWLKPRSSLRWQPYTQFPSLRQPEAEADALRSRGLATMQFLKARGWIMVAPPL